MQDRFAPDRVPPTIDESQDWELKSGEEEEGFTILEFSRKYVTCDDDDLPITVSRILNQITACVTTTLCVKIVNCGHYVYRATICSIVNVQAARRYSQRGPVR